MSATKKPVVYMVDSENVNDAWIRLVSNMSDGDDLLVFYTDKSPHMSYEKVIELTKLSDRPIEWIKCVEGSNALDFQLVTELGARVAVDPEYAYVIVSNDNGFDAAVRYWAQRGRDVRRMKSAECKQMAAARIVEDAEEAPAGASENPAGLEPAFMEEVEKLARSIQLSKLTLFHDAFVCMYDQETADAIYYYMKKHKADLEYLDGYYLPKRKARLKNYFPIALRHAGDSGGDADAVMEIYNHTDEPKKNLQKLNIELVKKFGQEQGTAYYKVLKKHVKVMSKL